ncbi:transglutaminase family protein [Heliorestis acidaminivorans]|uniref:Transglutaminase family protein n=1 Tax=Heliorestis acidaminivorans TaxID=553427 RepID=A0A6I0F7Q0_9FIRM|nr:transglutaminase family protein [Heliorestis acidaminivorans]KAB2953423.1 transglutaminase family protein [Heliorestis acidaminivorans]
MTTLAIYHRTLYGYSSKVIEGVSEVRLSPMNCHHYGFDQRLYSFQLKTEPLGAIQQHQDAFGNIVHTLWFEEPHDQLIIETRSIVERQMINTESNLASLSISKTISSVSQEQWPEDYKQNFAEWLMETPSCLFLPEVQALAQQFDLPAQGWPEVVRMARYLYENYSYQEKVTQVCSSVREILTKKMGVCQDFSHLLLALLRYRAIPARYVSGYIPCDGILRGGGASHAWVEVWLPGRDWQGIDPTNNCLVNDHYVKIAHGRDYHDVVPVKGIFRGRAKQSMQVTVDVQIL